MYEFTVSTESRYHDENVELAPAKPTGDSLSLRSKPHYEDEYVQAQVDPFAKGHRTEADVESGLVGNRNEKVAGVIRYDSVSTTYM